MMQDGNFRAKPVAAALGVGVLCVCEDPPPRWGPPEAQGELPPAPRALQIREDLGIDRQDFEGAAGA